MTDLLDRVRDRLYWPSHLGWRYVTLPRGWRVGLHSPIRVTRPMPREWECEACLRVWRFDQSDEGRCRGCGGRLFRGESRRSAAS